MSRKKVSFGSKDIESDFFLTFMFVLVFVHRYVYGHGCAGSEYRRQATYVRTSTDGLTWELPPNNSNHHAADENQRGLLFDDIFYLTAPIEVNGWFYAIGKTQEDSVGSSILCRSRSLRGPFERGPLLARGMRHLDVHLVEHSNKSHIVFFYTLIGDAPERILLGSLEMHDVDDWQSWRLLPGPTILMPTLEFEHGNANITIPSKSGSAGCQALAQFRDPSFLPDMGDSVSSHDRHLKGTLFYTVQGERAFAASKLDIDLDALFAATRWRDKTLIPDDILRAASLASEANRNVRNIVETPALFTGTVRSGTAFLCAMFQAVGLNISHDNDFDCGPYPGSDGTCKNQSS
jgi:hypothetical protein